MSNRDEEKELRLFDEANNALFNLHRYMETELKREDWREVYGFRCKLGFIQKDISEATHE